jgi:hypothetical protein
MSGECQTKNVKNYDKDDDEKPIIALDEGIIRKPTFCPDNVETHL